MKQEKIFNSLSRFDGLVISILSITMVIAVLLIFRGDQVGLRVVSLHPADGDNRASTRTQIRINFDRPVLPASEIESPLEISPPLSGTLRWTDQSLIFEPATALAPETTYILKLTGEVQGEGGRPLLDAPRWQFRTRSPQIVYLVFDQEGRQQLALVDPDQGQVEILTGAEGGVWDYAVAPDGESITYAVSRPDQGSNLWTLPLNTRQPERLLACPEAACSGVAWVPDGSRLVYERRTILAEGRAPGPPHLWWFDPDTDQTLPVFDDNQLLGYGAGWSADGAWLSFVAPLRQESQFYHLKSQRQIMLPNQLGEPPVWSPVEPLVLQSSLQQAGETFAAHLLRIDPATETILNLSGEALQVEDSAPVWSPDGRQIVFTRKPPRASMGKQLWIMAADGSDSRYLTNDPQLHHAVPDWSPDGRYLVFQTLRLKMVEAQPAISLMDLETEQVWEVASPGTRPKWLP